ncbi:hypothetical protein HHI36_022307 [Cryptolaemus montrouzieri]|uniref:Uncharacterized protein n=1 Tax=Cryptolaemus montrouzieri TaxID=559131 RepID=A0ABD2N078_9CUCU
MNSSINCFLCGKKLSSSGNECTILKERGIATLCDYSKTLGDGKYKLFEGKSQINVHEKCRVGYLVSKKVMEGSSTSSNVSSASTRSTSSSFDLKNYVYFVGKIITKVSVHNVLQLPTK